MWRRHCEITVVDGAVTLNDLGSRQGTFVGGVPVRSSRLDAEQPVRFGRVLFHLTWDDAQLENLNWETETDDPRADKTTTALEQAEAALSPRQRLVLRGLVDGRSEKQVACKLNISRFTVHNHVIAIYRALKVHTRAALLALFVRR